MPYRNSKTGEYTVNYPQRVRLDNGLTLTGPLVTDSLLEATGWMWEDYPASEPEPVVDANTLTNIIS